ATYNSEDYTAPWVLASGAAPTFSIATPTDFGDYFVTFAGNSTSGTLGLYKNEIGNTAGPTLMHSSIKTGLTGPGATRYYPSAGVQRDVTAGASNGSYRPTA